MKILHVINHLEMGGAQSLLAELVPIQQEMGHETLVLELLEAKDRTLSNKLIERGVKVESLSGVRSVRDPFNVIRLLPYLKKYDIVHVHLFPANYWVAIAKMLSRCKTPIITTEHSTTNKRRGIPIFKYIDNFIYQRYDEVVACADKALETFRQRYPKVRCTSIPNGVDITRYIAAEPYSKGDVFGVGNDSFVTTMVARFDYPKRQDTLVEAIAELPENFHGVFVGGSPEHPGLQKIVALARTHGVEDRIHFLYTRADVPRILKSSDVVLMASEYEGLSLSSIEGMACGRPFVATDVNGLREVVGGAGELFECGNSHELAELLKRLDSDRVYYDKVTLRCLARAAEYDIRAVALKYQDEYNKFIKNK